MNDNKISLVRSLQVGNGTELVSSYIVAVAMYNIVTIEYFFSIVVKVV